MVHIRATRSWFDLEWRALGGYWELLYFLVWRDIKVRYKQTYIGAGWAILQPLVTMLIFTAVFSGLANVPSEGVPYPVFALTGLLPWTFFSSALSRSGNSLVSNASLLTKVYFPRLIIPVAAVLGPLLDFAMALVLLLGLRVWFQIMPSVAMIVILYGGLVYFKRMERVFADVVRTTCLTLCATVRNLPLPGSMDIVLSLKGGVALATRA